MQDPEQTKPMDELIIWPEVVQPPPQPPCTQSARSAIWWIVPAGMVLLAWMLSPRAASPPAQTKEAPSSAHVVINAVPIYPAIPDPAKPYITCGVGAKIAGSNAIGQAISGAGTGDCAIWFSPTLAVKPTCVVAVEGDPLNFFYTTYAYALVIDGVPEGRTIDYVCDPAPGEAK